jgi:photosystem II stability/assembly factor-like uncharacterized protein
MATEPDMAGYFPSANRWVNIAYNNWDMIRLQNTLFWHFSSGSTPAQWSSKRLVNDYEASYRHRIIYSPGAAGPGSGVVYGGIDNNIYFSAPWLTGPSFAGDGPRQSGEYSYLPGISPGAGSIVLDLDTYSDMKGSNAGSMDFPSMRGLSVPVGHDSPKLTMDGEPLIWVESGDLDRAFVVSSIVLGDDSQVYAAATVSNDAGGNEGIVYRSTDDGLNWDRLEGLDNCWSLACVFEPATGITTGVLFAGGTAFVDETWYGAIYRTEDSGGHWTQTLDFPDGMVNDIVQDARGDLYAATGRNGLIYKSENGGEEWYQVADLGRDVQVHSIMQASNEFMFAGLGGEGTGSQIARSEDGNEWYFLDEIPGVLEVYEIIEVSEHLYAGVRGEESGWVYQSDLNGDSWDPMVDLPDPGIRAVRCFAPANFDTFYVGTENMLGPSYTQVYYTTPDLGRWELFGGYMDLANTVYSLATTESRIYAGTGWVYGNIYMCSHQAVGGINESVPGLPVPSFGMSQNYPNPFNPMTTIQYMIPQSDMKGEEMPVRLEIYSIRGRLVRTLIDEVKGSGTYKVQWDGRDDRGSSVSSGFYLYRIVAGEYTSTRKMTLVR